MIVGYGFAYFSTLNLLLDRNTVLMMKDTYIARFNTLLSIQFRTDKALPTSGSPQGSLMYEYGVVILSEGGNAGYDNIKMLEPKCMDQLAKLAHQYRPLIPLFTDFTEHIKKTLQQLEKTAPSIQRLKSLIDSCLYVEVVLTMYGSFRHWGHPFVDYLKGLEALYHQTTFPKLIDGPYTETLASDLALLVIRD